MRAEESKSKDDIPPGSGHADLPRPSSLDPATLLDTLEHRQPGESFDPIAFLNRHYTSESALLQQLPSLSQAVDRKLQTLDDRIAVNIQRQSENAETTKRHVQDAQTNVVELQQRILEVQRKASQSEKAVIEITKDMKQLDACKNHLQRTITTLKQLHMLVHGIEQLRMICKTDPIDYKSAAHLIDATRLLLSHFDPQKDNSRSPQHPPIAILRDKVDGLQEHLRVGLVRGFRIVSFGPDQALSLEKSNNRRNSRKIPVSLADVPVMTPTAMQGGVNLIDALGQDVKTQFVREFCHDHLAPYIQEFQPKAPVVDKTPKKRVSSFKQQVEKEPPPPDPISNLDNMEKRFIWFRQVLQEVDKKYPSVFPDRWNLHCQMARVFLQLTRDDILALLDGPLKDKDASNATILLKALQKTIVFEKEITVWLQQERGTVFDSAADKTEIVVMEPLIGVASLAFESYMGPYIKLERESMEEQLAQAFEDRTVDTRGERPVFISSTNLFVYMKGSITRCTALTRGKAFFLLYQTFKETLRMYSQTIDRKLPAAVSGSAGGLSFGAVGGKKAKESGTTASYQLPKDEEVTVCHVISTCEYCADTLEALEEVIGDTIDEAYKSKIDMMTDQDSFHDITAKSIRVLVSGLTNRMDTALRELSNINWATYENVGEESPYVRAIHEGIEPMVLTIRDLLPSAHFRNFCDKFADSFSKLYYATLLRLKRISEPGTQQLLLDVYDIKTLCLRLPVLQKATPGGRVAVSGGSTIAPAMYTKLVQKQFGKIETMLKLVGTPSDLLIENFKVQWVGGTATDLQNVMGLKGMKRTEQATYLEKFGMNPANALKEATSGISSAAIVSERVQALQDQGSNVASKVNSDLSSMRQKVDDFRKAFR